MKKRPYIGERVEVDHKSVFSVQQNWVEATVVDLLDQQFIAEVDIEGKPQIFRFYNAKDETWRYPNA
jgi:hypothetical protein